MCVGGKNRSGGIICGLRMRVQRRRGHSQANFLLADQANSPAFLTGVEPLQVEDSGRC